MAYFDLPLDQLRSFRPDREEPEDFDRFWVETLQEARRVPIGAEFRPVETLLTEIDTLEVVFHGFAGQPIKGWLQLPHHRPGPLPCVIEYLGYGYGRSTPERWLNWACAGYAHFVMDTRGQGGWVHPGDTPDMAEINPHFMGWLTQGLDDPRNHFYRRLFVDAVRAVEAARSHPRVDPERIAVAGISQGGGIALAAAALVPDVRAGLFELPFLCAFRRASQLASSGPYLELVTYLKTYDRQVDRAFRTLAYFDGVNMAARGRATARFTVGLMDTVCPPSTGFAACNHYAGEKTIDIYEYLDHDDRWGSQSGDRLRFMRSVL